MLIRLFPLSTTLKPSSLPARAPHCPPAPTIPPQSSFSANFFREDKCFRWDQSKCYTPDSPYYEITHHGLDPMMRRIISEMQLLTADDDDVIAYNGTRYTIMYRVGVKDLYEGLQSSAQLYVDYSIDRWVHRCTRHQDGGGGADKDEGGLEGRQGRGEGAVP